ncbi:Sulfur carrier protein ThiS adenylyltransferase (plasmid) [Candidatus Erwinia haradaeae]|uniref:Sulfur carrier protein ThiS adenylyltransferase n=1 Tax=Candidatus Erwinia haradaeae TaxID=1922217 RepID=A0A451DDR6_9GAMM|nr:HesA/MoeB/ThiF family protein [Candidatus Erwinia haradaeae]VFP84639.1 Sulfur carrier protein ThiS adenylyltransferase [Candidatus Erwinia haradaeae]
MLNNQDFLRYSRQLLLNEIGDIGQKNLQSATVLLCGLGGLGSPAALYLAAAGVGTLLLADDDRLHLTNLQRQILYKTNDIGQMKSEIAKRHLSTLNPNVRYVALSNRLKGDYLNQKVCDADVVLDCSDNIVTRHNINAACIQYNTPLISASAVGFCGQLFFIEPPWKYGCYACLFPSVNEIALNCRNSGILGPLVGIMGSLQALEAIKIICKISMPSSGKLRLFDGISLQWRTLTLSRSHNCTICAKSTKQKEPALPF